jgi:hypothetical protein
MTGFIEHLYLITANDYNAGTNLNALLITVAHAKYSMHSLVVTR